MIHYFFSWYSGSIWGNLIASAIWTVPAYLYGRFHFKKLHAKHDAMHEDIKRLQRSNTYGNNTY